MTYNVNFALETQIRNAANEAALKEAVLNLASSIVGDLQRIDARREAGDNQLSREIEDLKRRLSQIEAQVAEIYRRNR